ncbi:MULTISPECIES: universal stress protein [Dietzia]|uniref:Universal stress protein n=1 Tax=Dietzia cinnamea TaxID=321318 RepID=A0AAW5Q6C6_9ACTN|nr:MULTISPECIES: universal stress protein [Dietzia]KZO59942.1 universal stress protein [Dietzia maris]AVM65119.1 universal stress protein [Dietzia sp. oral taxon 368]MBM7229607.1 universal stress protein [Dietzia cinnamea]MCT1640161.1 universal stress protein [Dietzia cinnamea]MCT1710401.1 universal stress protein [Dietzia cinnamea]
MSAYTKVVVGTDGSESSYRAVDRAARLAADAGATLVIACAYVPADPRSVSQAADQLGDDAYQIRGDNPAEDIVRGARERALVAGATQLETRTVRGAPVESLIKLADEVDADLLVVGNKGLNSLTGRLLGSVPADAARRATCDVLIVHTT